MVYVRVLLSYRVYLIDSVHVMALLVGLVAHLDPRAPQGPGNTTLNRTH